MSRGFGGWGAYVAEGSGCENLVEESRERHRGLLVLMHSATGRELFIGEAEPFIDGPGSGCAIEVCGAMCPMDLRWM